jgi:putative FmdB family regulatory protein
MPIYNFQCDDCQTVFDLRATFQEKERGLSPVCPQCQGQHAHQLISAGWLLGGRSATSVASAPAWGCSPGGGCCG